MSSQVSPCCFRSDPCRSVSSRIRVKPRPCRAVSSRPRVHPRRVVSCQTTVCQRVRVMSAPPCQVKEPAGEFMVCVVGPQASVTGLAVALKAANRLDLHSTKLMERVFAFLEGQQWFS